MQLIAIVVLFWQRRRVTSLLRRGWGWAKTTSTEAPSGSRWARATRLTRQAAARGWRAVDTEANAGRVARFIAWMREVASSRVVARTTSANESTF
jgi:hypothetical protein